VSILTASDFNTYLKECPMKKDQKNRKLLRLNTETVKKLDENDLKKVIGGGSCLPPPPAAS
jgi:bacteriocin-like protein